MSKQQSLTGNKFPLSKIVPDGGGYSLVVTALDFSDKTIIDVQSVSGIDEAILAGKYVWIDLDYSEADAARNLLYGLKMIEDDLVGEIISEEEAMQLTRYTDYMHLVLNGCRIASGGHLSMQRIDTVIDEKFFLTVHQGPHSVIDAIRSVYRSDFVRFAKTPSFLIYELWDALADHYAGIEKHLEKEVEYLQSELVKDADDEVFTRVSDIGENLLHFRGVLMSARKVINDLAGRRSHLVSEATQTSLNIIAGTLERLLQDVLVDREILTQSLSLQMSIASHQTNRAMSKLTVVSAIFLPLTFLCGVYGMNFAVFPEIHWKYGYVFFWSACITIVLILLGLLRRYRLL